MRPEEHHFRVEKPEDISLETDIQREAMAKTNSNLEAISDILFVSCFTIGIASFAFLFWRIPSLTTPMNDSWTMICLGLAIFVAGAFTSYFLGYVSRARQTQAIRTEYEALRARSERLLAYIDDRKIGR